MHLILVWIGIAIAMVIIDLATSAFLFSWIGLGAIAAVLCDLLNFSLLVQIIVFAVVSLIAIGIGYPWAKKKFKTDIKTTPLMEETYIGLILDSEKIIKETGLVKVGGVYWTVINEGEEIKKGDQFIITGIEGTKLMIKKYKK